jgi:hypothetical protein
MRRPLLWLGTSGASLEPGIRRPILPEKQKGRAWGPGLSELSMNSLRLPGESAYQGSTPIMSAAMNANAAQIIKALIGRVSPMA